LGPDACLARLGDRAAQRRLAERLQSSALPDKTVAIDALRVAGAKQQAYALLPFLSDPDPVVKSSAAEALGALGEKRALGPLRVLLQQPMPLVRISAAVALHRLGDSSGDALLAETLKSDVPDVRLMSASAFAGTRERAWLDAVKPLLSHSNAITRLQAADLLATADPAAARPVLAGAVKNANPAVRIETARIIEHLAPPDPKLLRQLLADTDPGVRLHAAGGIVGDASTRR
jgi:HEAT repeat protein